MANVYIVLIFCACVYILRKITDRTHNKPNPVKYWFNFIAFYLATMLSAIIIFPVCIARPKNVSNARAGANIIKIVTKLLVRDVDFELRNGEILAEERGAVIIGNHQSSLDILGLFTIWHVVKKLSVVAKIEIFYLWPFGLSAYLAGIIFIHRNNGKDTYKQLEETTKVMIKDKTKICIFPEGTRNIDGENFLPFKKGAFNMAVKAQVPIIPIVFSPYYFIDSKKRIFNKGHVVIQCLDPVPTTGLTMDDVPKLSEKLREIMTNVYQNLAKEVLEGLPSDYRPKENRIMSTNDLAATSS